jgi:hypothetical protein
MFRYEKSTCNKIGEMSNEFYNSKILLVLDKEKKSLSNVIKLNSEYKRRKARSNFLES